MVSQRDPADTSWLRAREGMGVWEHRGKVAVAGWGVSPIDRRWDGVSPDKALGAYCMISSQQAIEDAGLTLDDIDGVITSPNAETNQPWAPRPYLAPPFDSEDGITKVSARWLTKQMGLKNVKYMDPNAPDIGGMMGLAAQAVGDGRCNVALVNYCMGNIEGRYGQSGQNADDYIEGEAVFSATWGYQAGAAMNSLMIFKLYCNKYGKSVDALAPFAVNQRRNGLMTPWGFYSQHEPYQITEEDYLNSRYIEEPLRILDCDRPVNCSTSFIVTTAERARTMKQKPVYILNHCQNRWPYRSSMGVLEEEQEASRSLARKMWEGSRLGPKDVDVFNPYDGYLQFTQQFLEGFQWHGVDHGDALDFYAEDISVEGPHPFLSSGGNNGVGRIRAGLFTDSIEQLRGQAGKRQIQIRCETALAGCTVPTGPGFVMFSKEPN